MTKRINIRAIRKQLGLTQQGFAYTLRVSMSTVANWEAGRSNPSSLALRQINALLGKRDD